jgi:DNA repair ATPase RecN
MLTKISHFAPDITTTFPDKSIKSFEASNLGAKNMTQRQDLKEVARLLSGEEVTESQKLAHGMIPL